MYKMDMNFQPVVEKTVALSLVDKFVTGDNIDITKNGVVGFISEFGLPIVEKQTVTCLPEDKILLDNLRRKGLRELEWYKYG